MPWRLRCSSMGYWLNSMSESDIVTHIRIPATPPRRLLEAFGEAFPRQTPDVMVRAPGRVNLLGGHVDLHEGTVLAMAIDRGIWLAAALSATELVTLYAADLGERVTFSLRHLEQKKDVVGGDLPRWARYPAGVAWALQQRGLTLAGLNVVFMGNLLMAAGLSSSAAVEEAFAIAWQSLSGWHLPLAELAGVGREAERNYMEIGIGVQDQFVSLHGRAGHALWLDCRTLDYKHAAFPSRAQIVVCDTNTRRELVKSAYNNRAGDAHAAAHTIRLVEPQVKTLRDVTPEQLEKYRGVLSETQYKRARHVVTEIERVQQGLDALDQGDVVRFGRLMNESYWSARCDYGSSSDALDAMWQAATRHSGCYGARYSGGGEAGAVVALVDSLAIEDFIATASASYQQQTGREGQLFAVHTAAGAGVLF